MPFDQFAGVLKLPVPLRIQDVDGPTREPHWPKAATATVKKTKTETTLQRVQRQRERDNRFSEQKFTAGRALCRLGANT